MRAYLELFAGGAACALALMGGALTVPPVGYMGGKRKLARSILGAAGLRVGEGAKQLLLVDAGEWGNVWSEVVRDGRGLAARIMTWEGRDPSELWRELAAAGRPEDPQERAAAYLWLQGRSASCTPVWWDVDGNPTMARSVSSGGGTQLIGQAGLVMPSNGSHGPGLIQAHPAPGEAVERAPKEKGRRSTGSGIMRPATVAHRIVIAHVALTSAAVRVERSHPTASDVADWLGTPGDLAGVVALLDPPYVGATRYEATCPRSDVVTLARDYASLGARVIVCEAEALDELPDWHALDLRAASQTAGKPEWLTCSHEPDPLAMSAQLNLWSVPV